uniref:Uncharacterized protein n=1 Tax=Arundo donax TaxID=35708 RepID=A0A0A8ZHW5_ARUDO
MCFYTLFCCSSLWNAL